MTVPNKAVSKAKATEPPKSRIPSNVKRPDDHQSAKEDVTGPVEYVIVDPVTEDEYTIDRDALDDAELMEHFTTDNFVGALIQMLGYEQWAKWKTANRDEESGRVRTEPAARFLKYALGELKRKNS